MTTVVILKIPQEPQYYYTLTDGYRGWAKDFKSAICSGIYEMTAQRQTCCIVTEETDGTYISAGESVPRISQRVVFTATLADPSLFTYPGIQ